MTELSGIDSLKFPRYIACRLWIGLITFKSAGSGSSGAIFKQLYSERLFLKPSHQVRGGRISNDPRKLSSITSDEAGSIYDGVIDQPLPVDIDKSEINERVDLIPYEVRFDFRAARLPLLR